MLKEKGRKEMKHGKSLTKKQKVLLASKHLKPENWLVERDTTEVTVFIHKYDKTRKFEVHKER